MQQQVVILLVVMKSVFLAGDHRANNVRNDSETISVRQNSRQSHKFAVSRIIRYG